jgi:large subunit ribosomal protein L17
MRHGMNNRKLGRTSSHRLAMLRNQIASLLEHGRIKTTLPKAKELRPLAEKLVTRGRTDSVHNRRMVRRDVADQGLIKKLFEEISPRFQERPGGYLRITKLGVRPGDAAEMAILEFVDHEQAAKPAPADAKGKKKAKSKDAAAG